MKMPMSPGRKKAQKECDNDASSDSQLEQVFSLLNIAIQHEDDGDNAQAYDNYMHAVTIMEQKVLRLESEHLQNVENVVRKSPSRSPGRKFHHSRKSSLVAHQQISVEQMQWEFQNRSVVPVLREKIKHYSRHADDLIQRSSSGTSSSSRSNVKLATAPDFPQNFEQEIPYAPFECPQGRNVQPARENETKNFVPKIVSKISDEDEEARNVITEFTTKANAALSRALDLDGNNDASGAFEEYMQAIEWELKALQLVKEHKSSYGDNGIWESMEQKFTEKVSNMMSRAEKLKALTKGEQSLPRVP